MAASNIPKSWVIEILRNEHADGRFESFANIVASIADGQPIVGTSKSWDLSRDGRTAKLSSGVFVFTSLEKSEKKPESDADGLSKSAKKITRIYIFCSHPISEHTQGLFIKGVHGKVGANVDVEVNGSLQIADLVEREENIRNAFQLHYSAELSALRVALQPKEQDVHIHGLQLALGTFGLENSQQLREELHKRIILSILQSGPLSVSVLLQRIKLNYGIESFSEITLTHCCESVINLGYIEKLGPKYSLTDAGKTELANIHQTQVTDTLLGGNAIRATIEKSLGQGITTEQWRQVWTELQNELSGQFYIRGQQFVKVISNFLDNTRTDYDHSSLRDLLDVALTKVATKCAQAPQREQLKQALHDTFLPGDPGGAFEWLSGVAASFAALCTLGFAHDVYDSLRHVLSTIRFFFDTDVVISFLCEHEAGHDASMLLHRMSMQLERPIMITHAVAEETARHAMKAYVDYEMQISSRSTNLQWFEFETLQSAFTREFERLRTEGKVVPSQWTKFIERYAGPFNRGHHGRLIPDTLRMRRILSSEHFLLLGSGFDREHWGEKIERLTSAISEFRENRQDRHRGAQSKLPKFGDEDDYVSSEKARLDAELLAAVARSIEDSERAGQAERFILVSSSGLLRDLSTQSKSILGAIPEVLSLSEAAVMASLLPESPISLRALRGLLFEGEFHNAVSKLGLKFLNVLRFSQSVTIPGASRGVLLQEFSDAIIREARVSRKDKRAVLKALESDPIRFGRMAATIVDSYALQNPIEREKVIQAVSRLSEAKTTPDSGRTPHRKGSVPPRS